MTKDEKKDTKDIKEDTEERLYELGYHVVPTVSQEEIDQRVSEIGKDTIESNGGTVTSQGVPSLIGLAYPITKAEGQKRTKHESGYFGWFQFYIAPENVDPLKKTLDATDYILRYIIMHVEKEKKPIRASKKMRFFAQSVRSQKEISPKPAVANVAKKEQPAMSEEELDKTIEELIVN
jgi:ribosomal protein S6